MKLETFVGPSQRIEPVDLIDLSWTPWRRIMLSARSDAWQLVDEIDHRWMSENVWNESWGSRTPWEKYAKRNVGPDRATLRAHREIMILADPRSQRFMATHHVDHINGQTLDNRRANLRWVTNRQNAANRFSRAAIPTLESIVSGLLASLGWRPQHDEVPF